MIWICTFCSDLYNMELNDMRKTICLGKSEGLFVKKTQKKTVSNVIEKFVEHSIHCLPCSYMNDVTDLSPQQL